MGKTKQSVQSELQCEQAYIDRAYERLDALSASSRSRLENVLRTQVEQIDPFRMPGPEHQAIYERDVLAYVTAVRSRGLSVGDYPLCFGRIDTERGDRWYLGRVAVPDENHDPLVVDWRAPVAEAFYRATGREPLGLTLRRHLTCEGRTLVAVEDERFTSGELGLAGPGALLGALERRRTGKMRDIVATVQREQDEVIRAGMRGILVVQGGPGTGKTAVALHRAAYLLFTHRTRLGHRGILVVGPNPVFLGYIDQVLPALGESGAVLATPDGVVGRQPATGIDGPAVRRLKGDARMAAVIAQAVRDRRRAPRSDVAIAYDDIAFGELELRVGATALAHAAAMGSEMRGSHNDRRPPVERLVLGAVFDAYVAEVARRARDLTLPRGMSAEDLVADRDAIMRRLSVDRAVRRLVDRVWPLLTPEEVVHDLYGSDALLESASRGTLTGEEWRLLRRPWSDSPDDVGWTSADLPLLEEAFLHVGPLEARRLPADADEEDERGSGLPVFGHIVVDEAQDLSPMQLRVLGRRTATGSITLVGDLAQSTGGWRYSSWEALVDHLGHAGRGVRVSELTVNYRTPAEIATLAARVLKVASPQMRPPRSVRRTGRRPEILRVSSQQRSSVVADVARTRSGDGNVAVIAPDSLQPELLDALQCPTARTGNLGAPVTLVGTDVMKGLEFDSVVVVEPSGIIEEAEGGRHALYVALTRTTKHLAVVHAGDLPEELAAGR